LAQRFRSMLAELRESVGDRHLGEGPYMAWEGSITPVLALTLTRALARTVSAHVALSTIHWLVQDSNVRRVSDAWLALAFGAGEESLPRHNAATVRLEEASFRYLERMTRELDL
jgi:hypothetical protein